MKKQAIVIVSILISMLIFNSSASAIDLYAFGSYWDKKDLEGNWGTGIGATVSLISERIRLDCRTHYFGDSDLGDKGVKIIPIDLGGQLHILPTAQFDPYILAGVSYNYVDSDELDLDPKFGGYLGGGLDIALNLELFKLFAEAMYRFADVDNLSGDDFNADGFSANIGLKFHF